MPHYIFYDSPVGHLYIEESRGFITRLSFADSLVGDAKAGSTPLLQEAVRELEEYFQGQRQTFDLPILPQGTPFMLRVWQALCEIPYGQTASYQDIAAKAGNIKACRAVGMANNRNQIVILIPCHRVIGKNGALVGFGGGLPIKEYLLALEKGFKSNAVKD